MSMTKKDFVGIAKKLAAIRPIHPNHDSINHMDPAQVNYQKGAFSYWDLACRSIAVYFYKANPNFDFDKFIEACND